MLRYLWCLDHRRLWVACKTRVEDPGSCVVLLDYDGKGKPPPEQDEYDKRKV